MITIKEAVNHEIKQECPEPDSEHSFFNCSGYDEDDKNGD